MTTWLTATDVNNITGFTPTDVQLAQAGAIVDIYTNRTVGASAGMSTRDLYWVKQAVAWQAVYVSQNVGITQRSLVSHVHQDGLQAQYPNEASLVLAPLAQRAIRNLSWKGSRTLAPQKLRHRFGYGYGSGYDYGYAYGPGFLTDENDDPLAWDPIAGGW